jgi:NitT/TauT family transport system substrate-binding protein
VIQVSDFIDLVANGLVVGDKLMADDPELVRAMVRASLRGIKDTIENPDDAFAIVRDIIPEITDAEAPTQRQVLEASIGLWQSETPGLSKQRAWQDSVDFMVETGLLEDGVEIETLYTNDFVTDQ